MPDSLFPVQRYDGTQLLPPESDSLAIEEPLEIRVEGQAVAVVMRTPGHDEDLAAGFLLTEGVVRSPSDIFEINQCPSQDARGNVVEALTKRGATDLDKLTRHVFTGSSCGLCGKATIDAVFQQFPPVTGDWRISPALLTKLPGIMREHQAIFSSTGGLHACALFHTDGTLAVLREDVGRHNAMDKVLGWALRHLTLPLTEHLLLVSGRISFEIVQKALAAGVPFLAAVSAPTTLAVEMASEAGITLVGFLRNERYNIYCHPQRLTN